MAVIREQDMEKGRLAWSQWRKAALEQTPATTSDVAADNAAPDARTTATTRLAVNPELPRPIWAMAVRYTLFMLERRAPGPGVEVRVAPWGAVKILDGPASDPHNLTPPDVIELDPDVWLRLAAGITAWDEEREAGHITAVGERDDLSDLLPL
ncbi:sterol carrier family protein [Bifidobacterium aerophilum]|uniref:Bacterial SCP orthologue domain-containing protein n=1 Tax=Bifidobacterium aerophilum TaxID=1798155 RepID=A0A6N9Z4A2_9BIFI|nr:sterol carrier family protein [Bifidobacterium aerophilum]NEG89507.1 hypothetical protein [Bifidobacterium aerophilum]